MPNNEPVVSQPVNERPSKFSLSASMRQAIEHGAPAEVIDAYRSELKTHRAEAALRRLLDAAPPLRPEQVSYLRAVLDAYEAEGGAHRVDRERMLDVEES